MKTNGRKKTGLIFIILLILILAVSFLMFRDFSGRITEPEMNAYMSGLDMDTIFEYIEENCSATKSYPEMQTVCYAHVINYDCSHIYTYAFVAAYGLDGEKVVQKNSAMLPIALNVAVRDGQIEIIGFAVPEDGVEYPRTLKKMFPSFVIEQLSLHQTNESNILLQETAYERAALLLLP